MEHLNYACEKVWRLIEFAKAHRYSFSETTITDLILLYLYESNGLFHNMRMQVAVVSKTSKANEPKKGTDWEWWIGNRRNGWMRYAVQAKKIYYNEGDFYGALKKHPAPKGSHLDFQHEVLDYYAWKNDAIPLYAFYNYVRKDDYGPFLHCGYSPRKESMLGITVTPLKNAVWAIETPRKKNFDAIHRHCETIPMRCLSCPAAEELPEYKSYFDERARHMSIPEILDRDVSIREGSLYDPKIIPRGELPRDFYKGDPIYSPGIIIRLDPDD